MVKLKKKINFMVKWLNGKQVLWWNGEISNFLQWGYCEISRHNGIIFLPSTTPLPPIHKLNNRSRGIFYSSISASFSPFPSSSDFFPIPIPLPLPILHLHIFLLLRLNIHPYPCFNIYPYFSPHYLPLHLPLPHHLSPPIPIFLPLPLPYIPRPHSSQINIPHYHLHLNQRSQIIQWIAALIPIFTSL